MTGQTVGFSLLEIPEYEALELSGSLETARLSEAAKTFVAHSAIPIAITREEIDAAAAAKFVVKVVYLPRPERAESPLAGVETLVTERLNPGVDPLAEAKRRGEVLAILRLGNRVRAGQAPSQVPAEKKNAVPQRAVHFPTRDRVTTIACSADGKLIAAANGNPTFLLMTNGISRLKDNWEPTVEIFDGETGKPIVSLKLRTAEEDAVLAATERVFHFEVTALAFSADGSSLAVGTSIGQVKLFDPRTGELIQVLDDEPARLAAKEAPDNWKVMKRAIGSVRSLAFSPDGSLLAVCGESFAEFADVFDGIENLGRSGAGPGRLKVWDMKAGAVKHDLAEHSQAFGIDFAAGGELLVSTGRFEDGGRGNGLLVWDATSGKQTLTIAIDANGGTHAVVFSPTKKLVAIGSRHFDKENDTSSSTISVAYPLSGVTEWQRVISGYATPIGFSPDGKTVLILCGGKSIQFVNVETGAVEREIQATDSPHSVKWNDSAVATQGGKLVIGGADKDEKGSVDVFDLGGSDHAKQ